MSGPAEICDACGKTITDEELETGSAISVLGRSFCPGCKAEAVKDISIEDLAAPETLPKPSPQAGPHPPSAMPASKPAPRPARSDAGNLKAEPKKSTAPGETPRTLMAAAAPRRPSPRRGPKPEVLALGGVGILGAVLVVLLATRGGSPPTEPPRRSGPEMGPKTTPADPAAARLARAEQTYLKTLQLAGQPGAGFEEIFAALDRANADCAGTPYEAKLAQLRLQKLKEKETADAERTLKPLVDELRAGVAADPKFARFAELSEKLQKARELALQGVPARVPEINQLRQDYVGRYEKAAEPHALEIEQTAQVLADERRYDDAIAKIETFPRDLRLSSAWKNLDRLRQDIERRKKLFPPKK
jgi:hypothetical protein